MKIFVTGATGFVGSAVVQELLGAGHQVLGLVRSDQGAARLAALGIPAHRGDVEDVESLKSGAARADAVIHTAFVHDFSRFKEYCEVDRRAVEALGAALVGTTRPLIVTSALGVMPRGIVSTEAMPPVSGPAAHPRAASEQAADAVAARGVRVAVVRLPPSTHGPDDIHFVPTLIRLAREKGASVYIDDGENRWPAVHRLDAAVLYRLAAEKAESGARYHAVADEGVPLRELANVIGRRLGLPVVSTPREEAPRHFGGFTHFASLDVPASNARTRAELGWVPRHPGLLADLEQGHYFAA